MKKSLLLPLIGLALVACGSTTTAPAATTSNTPAATTSAPAATTSAPAQQVSKIELTTTSLAIPSEAYGDYTSTIEGVEWLAFQCADYGDGIQMRVKNGNYSYIANQTATPTAIDNIVINYNVAKSNFSNEGVFNVHFYNALADETPAETIQVDTVKDTDGIYNVTPVAKTYKFVKITRTDISTYAAYVNSFEINLVA